MRPDSKPNLAGFVEKYWQKQCELFAAIDQADEMIVDSEGFKRELLLYRSSNRKDFEQLKSAITLKRSGGPFVCACMDGPEIASQTARKQHARPPNLLNMVSAEGIEPSTY